MFVIVVKLPGIDGLAVVTGGIRAVQQGSMLTALIRPTAPPPDRKEARPWA